MSITECARLQGFCHHKLKWPIKCPQRRAFLGNTMSINVLQVIVNRIFTSLGHHISDPWTNQAALKSFKHDASSGIINDRGLFTQYFRRLSEPLITTHAPTTTPTAVTGAALPPSPSWCSSPPPSPLLSPSDSSSTTVHPPVLSCPSSDEETHTRVRTPTQVMSTQSLRDDQKEEIPFQFFSCKSDGLLAILNHSPIT